MGLFSFNKDSGEKNTGLSDQEKGKFMEEIIKRYNLPIEGLKVQVDGSKASLWGIVDELGTKEKIIVSVGNIQGISEVEDFISLRDAGEGKVHDGEIDHDKRFYTVQKGDSLSKISKTVYGDPMKYTTIFEANKPMLKDPNLIYPGQVLRIPEL